MYSCTKYCLLFSSKYSHALVKHPPSPFSFNRHSYSPLKNLISFSDLGEDFYNCVVQWGVKEATFVPSPSQQGTPPDVSRHCCALQIFYSVLLEAVRELPCICWWAKLCSPLYLFLSLCHLLPSRQGKNLTSEVPRLVLKAPRDFELFHCENVVTLTELFNII